jgi:hypothetical protein
MILPGRTFSLASITYTVMDRDMMADFTAIAATFLSFATVLAVLWFF